MGIGSIRLPAQEKASGDPYQARVRLGIDASPDQRVHLFRQTVKRLQVLGFVKDKGLEGEELHGDTVTGRVPAATARRLADVPYVQTVLLVPAKLALPADAAKFVLTDLTLAGWFSGERQRELSDKARGQLAALGFLEAVGYDPRGFTRVLGWLPAGRLDALLKGEAKIEVSAAALPKAGRSATQVLSPFRIITVLPEPEGAEPAKEPAAQAAAPPPLAAEQAFREKVSADLRTLVAGLPEDKQKQPLRAEIVLRTAPAPGDLGDLGDLGDRLGFLQRYMVVEGRLGGVVTGLIYPSDIDALAALPDVSTVRLPQPARPLVLPPADGPGAAAPPIDFIEVRPQSSARGELAGLVRKQTPQRSAVVAADFRGFQAMVGKRLPARTQLIDLTAERHADLQPEPMPEGDGLGNGTRLALALQQALPSEELFLVRIAPEAAYQVEDVARAVAGRAWRTESIRRREQELARERARLEEERVDLRIERRILSNSFGNDPDSESARKEHLKRQQRFEQDEKAYNRKVDAYLGLTGQMRSLQGVGSVLVGLAWLDGQAQFVAQPPGEPRGLRALEPSLLARANWIFTAPRLQGQVWTGLFRDENNDAVMEFDVTDAGGAQKAFLAWRPYPWAGKDSASPSSSPSSSLELPAGAVVQVTLQWREVHAPEWKRADDEDSYRRPIVPLQVVVLRQRDPSGKTAPADLFEVAARSTDLPDRVENTPRYAIYQSTLRFQVPDRPGRYAIRLEGRKPLSTLPPDFARLPGGEKWELHPTLRLEIVDPATRARGRAIFHQADGRR